MITITTLVNNSAPDGLHSEHGLAFWIDFNGKCVLFDTGQTDVIQKNAERIGINLTNTDTVVLSHGHYDHTGGVPSVFTAAGKATLYLHPRAMDLKYSRKAGRVKMVWTELPTEVFPGLFVTGTMPRTTSFEDTGGAFYLDESCTSPDELLDDQAIYFKIENGLAFLLGCGYTDVVNTLSYIVGLTGEKRIHTVMGGMHLLNASVERIGRMIKAIKKYDVQELGLAHCTGNNAMDMLKDAFPDQCFECSVGIQRTY